jgi:hypothetical protein
MICWIIAHMPFFNKPDRSLRTHRDDQNFSMISECVTVLS